MLSKADKKKLSTRKGMLNYIAFCRYKEEMPWYYNRYNTNKKKTNAELKLMCKDWLLNSENGVKYLKEMAWGKRGYNKEGRNGYNKS